MAIQPSWAFFDCFAGLSGDMTLGALIDLGPPLEEVHFHELGALDTIVDVVGVAFGLEGLNISQVFCRKLRGRYGNTYERSGA